jgi:hypothetical protein
MSASAIPEGAAARLRRWAYEACHARSVRAPDLAAALRLNLAEASSLGRQRIFPPSPEASRLQFVLDDDGETVLFIELATTPTATAQELTAVFGPGQTIPPGPHQSGPTVVFDDLRPAEASRSCSVMARLRGDDPVLAPVESVTMSFGSA